MRKAWRSISRPRGDSVVHIVASAVMILTLSAAPVQSQGSPASVAPVFLSPEAFIARRFNTPPPFDRTITGFFSVVSDVNTLESGKAISQFERFRDEASAAIDTVPIPSGSISVRYALDPSIGVFTRKERPLAPALSQNAPTNGRNILTFGVSYSYVDYRDFEGFDRERVVFFASEVRDANGTPVTDGGGRPAVVGELYRFKLRKSIYSFSFQYGVLENLDFGILIPLIDQTFSSDTIARFYLENLNGSIQPARVGLDQNRRPTGFATADNRLPPLPSFRAIRLSSFNVPAGDAPLEGTTFRQDDTGIGDLVIRAKYFLASYDVVDFGFLFSISVPTGDQDNLLGVGSVRFDPRFVVSSSNERFSAHLNGGYHADSEESARNRADYAIGGEVRINDWVTLLVDQVARIETSGSDKVKKFEIVPGLKVNPYADLVVAFNAFVPLNHEGLTTDWTPNASLEASLHF